MTSANEPQAVGPMPDEPGRYRWQHYVAVMGGANSGAFFGFSDEQRNALTWLGRHGWELVSTSVLASNGWLLMAFKRPWETDEEPPPVEYDWKPGTFL